MHSLYFTKYNKTMSYKIFAFKNNTLTWMNGQIQENDPENHYFSIKFKKKKRKIKLKRLIKEDHVSPHW